MVPFTTLTNVNFDAAVHVDLLKQSQEDQGGISRAGHDRRELDGADRRRRRLTDTLPETEVGDAARIAPVAGIMYEQDLDPDVRSLAA